MSRPVRLARPTVQRSQQETPMTSRRYATKAEWAAAMAADLDRQAAAVGAERSGSWRRRHARRDGAARLMREAARYRRMAERYVARGV